MILNLNKQDSRLFSAELATQLGNINAAIIVQQLNYWTQKENTGVWIDGAKYIYNTFKDWVTKQFQWLSIWQFRQAMKLLRDLEIVKVVRYLAKKEWNQTNYYSLDYDKLREFVEKHRSAESTETVEMWSSSPQGEGFSPLEMRDTNISSYTKKTSKENIQRKPPSISSPIKNRESENPLYDPWIDLEPAKEKTLTDKKEIDLLIDKNEFSPKAKIPRDVTQDKLCKQQTTKIERPKPPWRSPEEFNDFYQALIAALPVVANSHSPQGLAKVIIKDLEAGKPHTYWDDWKAGLEIGESTKPEWEAKPGIPYPMFVEYLAEKCKDAHDSPEKGLETAWDILSHPKKVTSFWKQFKRSMLNVSDQVDKDIKLGVQNPNTPVWMRERVEPTIQQALSAGEKLRAIAEGDISKIDLLSATKVMPKAEKESNKPAITNHINQMSIETINQLLQKPLMRKHLAPQIMKSDRFKVELNELGQPIKVKKRT